MCKYNDGPQEGKTAMDYALEYGHDEVVSVLKQVGVRVKVITALCSQSQTHVTRALTITLPLRCFTRPHPRPEPMNLHRTLLG